jgi:hypothetical protein
LAVSCSKETGREQITSNEAPTKEQDETISEDELKAKMEQVKRADNGFSIEGLALEDRLLFPPVLNIPKLDVSWRYNFLVAGNSLIYLSPSSNYLGIKIDPVLHDDGFFYFTFTIVYSGRGKYHDPITYEDVIFLGGGDIAMPLFSGGTLKNYYRFDVFPPPAELMQGKDHPLIFQLWDDGIKEIKASSVLREKTSDGEVVYDEKNLRQNFYDMDDGRARFNFYKKAWAENVPGDGIGESLYIEFALEADHMLILNGYVNLFRRELYKANNRVKKARIVSEDPEFSIEYEFDDVVKFSEIEFPQKTKAVIFFIEEVYKGEKYSDTCMTAVLLRQSMEFQDSWFVKGTPKYEEIVDGIIEEFINRRILP